MKIFIIKFFLFSCIYQISAQNTDRNKLQESLSIRSTQFGKPNLFLLFDRSSSQAKYNKVKLKKKINYSFSYELSKIDTSLKVYIPSHLVFTTDNLSKQKIQKKEEWLDSLNSSSTPLRNFKWVKDYLRSFKNGLNTPCFIVKNNFSNVYLVVKDFEGESLNVFWIQTCMDSNILVEID